MPEDGNFEANEKVFKAIMGPEHPGRVRTQGFGVIPSRYFPHSTTTPGSSNAGNTAFDRVVKLEEVVRTLQNEVRQLKENNQVQHPPPGSSTMIFSSSQQIFPNGIYYLSRFVPFTMFNSVRFYFSEVRICEGDDDDDLEFSYRLHKAAMKNLYMSYGNDVVCLDGLELLRDRMAAII
ncbi:hypothetical protein IEQ34_005341 [Dendrobium chrysotoxum]|uniref:Uncharacterized protein n=1 Tax=Dendrobium chrysotoxum TaxID=161865 RepID=A0AAV7HB77_DENCH|nr:hypothetical protein IEQ34_005341 [Dendrobium chrysotoxum]